MDIEMISVIGSILIGAGGIVSTVIATILSSRRTKEANAIAKSSLLRSTYIEEKRGNNQKIIDDITELLKIASPQLIDSDYMMIADIAPDKTLIDFLRMIGEKKKNLAYYANLIYMEMPIEDRMYYDLVLKTSNDAIEIYTIMETIRRFIANNIEFVDGVSNNGGAGSREQMVSTQIQEYRSRMDIHVKTHGALVGRSKQYVDMIKRQLFEELKEYDS